MSFQVHKYIPFVVPTSNDNMTLTYSVSKKDIIKRLILALHPTNLPTDSDITGMDVIDNSLLLLNNVEANAAVVRNGISNSVTTFITPAINYIQIQFGSKLISINC